MRRRRRRRRRSAASRRSVNDSRRALVVVVRRGRSTGPRTCSSPRALAVPRQRLERARARRCGSRRRATTGPTRGAQVGQLVVVRVGSSVDLMRPDRGDRARLGHAPGLQDRQADLLAVRLGQRLRHRRAAARDRPQRRRVAALQLGQHAHPDRRHARGDGDPLVLDQVGDAPAPRGRGRASRALAPARDRGVGEAPRVGVEHRHDRQDHVALAARRGCRRSCTPIVCRNVERCEYTTPFGLPVVPLV